MTLSVVCVYVRDPTWRRDYHGADLLYSREYPDKLKSMVERHLTVPHVFRCLTNEVEREYDVPLARTWPGWWNKVELFEAFRGPSLYFDLDTIITGNIDWLVQPRPSFAMWWYERLKPSGYPHWCSAFMSWDGDYSFLTTRFRLAPMTTMARHRGHDHGKGDQGYFAEAMRRARHDIVDIAAGHEDKIGTLSHGDSRPLVYLSGSKKPHLLRDHATVREHWR